MLIADFGELYNQARRKDEPTLKRVSNFVTNNGIRIEAHTAVTPASGCLYQQRRPDFIRRDDFEKRHHGGQSSYYRHDHRASERGKRRHGWPWRIAYPRQFHT